MLENRKFFKITFISITVNGVGYKGKTMWWGSMSIIVITGNANAFHKIFI